MKQYYESELIKEIAEARGHKKSSLHYESECVESWIEETKGAYPKLNDYQTEWLSYINKIEGGGTEQPEPEPPIGEFPYVVLSDVTEATIDNVVPYAYKSAILKGQTLKNLCPQKTAECSGNGWKYTAVNLDSELFKANSTYYFVVKCSNTNGVVANVEKIWIVIEGNKSTTTIAKTNSSTTFTMPSDYNSTTHVVQIRIHCSAGNSATNTITCDNMMIFDYYDGIELKTFPYVEYGIQSVKMPGLTTSNEDGTKTNILTVNEEVTLRSNENICDELNLLTGQLTQRIDEDGEVLSQEVVKTVELNIQDQDGKTLSVIKPIEGKMFLSTSGDTIKPLFSGEIPVEAITQNLASFIDLEMEE